MGREGEGRGGEGKRGREGEEERGRKGERERRRAEGSVPTTACVLHLSVMRCYLTRSNVIQSDLMLALH